MGVKDDMFTFNGKSTRDYGILLSGYDTYNAPSRSVETVTVPGRNGNLVIDNGRFENAEITYKCLVYKGLHDYEAFRAFMKSQKGYQRLEDTFHPEEYRLAVFSAEIEPKLKGDYEAASFKVVFDCKPQRYLKSGENVITLTNGGVVINETLFSARPLIRAYSAGPLVINGQTMTISSVDGYVDIDCDLMDAYKGSTNKNATISGTFPVLEPGKNTITYTGQLDIIPRFYTI